MRKFSIIFYLFVFLGLSMLTNSCTDMDMTVGQESMVSDDLDQCMASGFGDVDTCQILKEFISYGYRSFVYNEYEKMLMNDPSILRFGIPNFDLQATFGRGEEE